MSKFTNYVCQVGLKSEEFWFGRHRHVRCLGTNWEVTGKFSKKNCRYSMRWQSNEIDPEKDNKFDNVHRFMQYKRV